MKTWIIFLKQNSYREKGTGAEDSALSVTHNLGEKNELEPAKEIKSWVLCIMETKIENDWKEAGLVSSINYCSHEEEEEQVAGGGDHVYSPTSQHPFIPAPVGWEKTLLISVSDFIQQHFQEL